MKPIWTPDGRRLTFASDRGDPRRTQNLFWQRADGAAIAERLTTSSNEQLPGSWHPSGRFLAFDELHADTMRDVMILPMEGDDASGWRPGVPTVFVRRAADGLGSAVLARWPLAGVRFVESGRSEVYVRPFPARSGGAGLVGRRGVSRPGPSPVAKLFTVSRDR